jgi:hypothetical protein
MSFTTFVLGGGRDGYVQFDAYEVERAEDLEPLREPNLPRNLRLSSVVLLN